MPETSEAEIARLLATSLVDLEEVDQIVDGEYSTPMAGRVQSPDIDEDERVDFVLQINMMINASHEYIAGLPAHFNYWHNKDVANYLCKLAKRD